MNTSFIQGTVITKPVLDTTVIDPKAPMGVCGTEMEIYKFWLEVSRFSGATDVLMVKTPKGSLPPILLEDSYCISSEPLTLRVDGEIRTENRYDPALNRTRLIVFVWAKELTSVCEDEDGGTKPSQGIEKSNNYTTKSNNEIHLQGYICKSPTLRRTPKIGVPITDMLIAVNVVGYTSYIPCIAWGDFAVDVSSMPVGTLVEVQGRFQSRIYRKSYECGKSEERVAYEVSSKSVKRVEQIY